jgi:DNA-binding NarL/FixJ family response regulator
VPAKPRSHAVVGEIRGDLQASQVSETGAGRYTPAIAAGDDGISEPDAWSARGPKTPILVVSHHALLRDALWALLQLEADLSVVGTVGDASAALKSLRALKPLLVIVDSALPRLNGVELIGRLVALAPAVRILVLTSYDGEEHIRAALAAGAHGYILKTVARAELLRAIRTVVGGGQYLCAVVASKVIAAFVRNGNGANELVTSRERQVLTLVAQGQGNKSIARELGLSVKTVEKHRAHLMHKFALHNAAAVTLFAFQHGFIEVGTAVAAGASAAPAQAPDALLAATWAPRKSE